MTKRSLPLILLVAFALLCVEVPEWLTGCDDPSNDFVLMTSKPGAASFHVIPSEPLLYLSPFRRFLAPHPTSTSELPFVTGQELRVFFFLQKK